jgi:hypothetical protein
MIGFCCLNFGEFTKTTTGYAYENNGIRFKPIKKEKGLRLPWRLFILLDHEGILL